MADNNLPSAPPDTMRNADDLNPPQQSYADLLNALGIDDAPPSYTHIPPSLAPDRRYSLPPTSVPDYSQPRYHQPPTRPDKPHFSVDSPNLLNTPPPARPLSYYDGSPGTRLYPDPAGFSTPSYDGSLPGVQSTTNYSKLNIVDSKAEPNLSRSYSSSSSLSKSSSASSVKHEEPIKPAPSPPPSTYVAPVPSTPVEPPGSIAMTVFSPATPETTTKNLSYSTEIDPAPQEGDSKLPARYYEDGKDEEGESCYRKRCRHKCDCILATLIILELFAMGSAGTGIYSVLNRDCWLLYPTSFSGSGSAGGCVDADLPTLYTGYIMMAGTACMLICVLLFFIMLIFTCWKRCFRFINCTCAFLALIALGGAACFAAVYTLNIPFIGTLYEIEWYYWLVVASAGCSLPVCFGSIYLYFENTCCRDC